MIIGALFFAGLVLFLAGTLATAYVVRSTRRSRGSWLAFGAAIAAGALLAWKLALLEYPYRGYVIAGVPFVVAAFDAEGSDYVGPLSLVFFTGNVVVALSLPQLALAIRVRRHVRAARPAGTPEADLHGG